MFYSHIGEMCNLCEITEGQFLQGIVGGLYILQIVNWKKGESNPHGIAPARFWVWCAYQFHHLSNNEAVDKLKQTHDWASAPTDSSTGQPGSTIGARGLYFCVRDGNRCDSPARSTGTQACVRFVLEVLVSIKSKWEGLFGFKSFLSQVARPISTGQLHMLPCFHLRPIKQVIFL